MHVYQAYAFLSAKQFLALKRSRSVDGEHLPPLPPRSFTEDDKEDGVGGVAGNGCRLNPVLTMKE